MRLQVVNRSGYDSMSLMRFFRRGLKALGIRKPVRITVVSAPARSRGCAEVGGSDMVIAIASPRNFSLRRLARLFEHEAAHLKGIEHKQMNKNLLYSLGSIPDWAKNAFIKYRGRAPNQMQFLRRKS